MALFHFNVTLLRAVGLQLLPLSAAAKTPTPNFDSSSQWRKRKCPMRGRPFFGFAVGESSRQQCQNSPVFFSPGPALDWSACLLFSLLFDRAGGLILRILYFADRFVGRTVAAIHGFLPRF
jgi:hypothetical protein